jgi:hypothetical protein
MASPVDRSQHLQGRAPGGWWARRYSPALFSLVLTGGIGFLLLFRSWFSNPIAWDGFGYFLYLPLLFVHNDLGMTDPGIVQGMFAAYTPSDTFYQAHLSPTGAWVIRYTPGLAVLHAPGFVVAHLLASALGFPADGLSLPYQVAVLITSLCWLWAGLYWLLRFLRMLVPGMAPFLATALILYGTNLFDQAVEHPLMTHLYTFALLAALLWSTHRWHAAPSAGQACGMGLALGLSILVRPTNILAVLIPVLWPLGNMSPAGKLRQVLQQHRKHLLMLVTCTAVPVSILLLYWKVMAGTWLYNSYQNPGEGLDLLHPHLLSFLFSYRKGWLLHTPVVLIGLAGLAVAIPPSQRSLRLPLWSFIAVFLYVVSTWTIWYYPGGFGQRAAVDVLPVVAVGMAFAFHRAALGAMATRHAMVVLVWVLVVLLHFQLWQQRQHFRPPDRMTRAYYWATCLQLEPDTTLYHLLGPDRVSAQNAPLLAQLHEHAHWELQPAEGQGEHVLGPGIPFTPAWERPFHLLTDGDHAWVEVRGELRADDTLGLEVDMVLHMVHEDTYGYRTFSLADETPAKPTGWVPFTFHYLTPVPRRSTDILRVYAWHRSGPGVRLRNIRVRSLVPPTQ